MPFSFLPFTAYAVGGGAAPEFSVKIRRLSDGFYYDLASGKFSASPGKPRLALTASMQPDEAHVCYGSVSLDPAVFTDGLYVTLYFDGPAAKTPCDVDQFSVIGGQLAPPGKTDIAGRILEATLAAHKNDGTVGRVLNDIVATLAAIKTKLGS